MLGTVLKVRAAAVFAEVAVVFATFVLIACALSLWAFVALRMDRPHFDTERETYRVPSYTSIRELR